MSSFSLEIFEPTRITENIIIIFLLCKLTVKCWDEVLNKMYKSRPIYPKTIFIAHQWLQEKCNIISCLCGDDGKDMKTPKGTNFIASWGSLTCLLTNSWCMCPCLNKNRYGGFLYPVWSNANFGKHYVYLLDFFSRSDILTWRLNCYTT